MMSTDFTDDGDETYNRMMQVSMTQAGGGNWLKQKIIYGMKCPYSVLMGEPVEMTHIRGKGVRTNTNSINFKANSIDFL